MLPRFLHPRPGTPCAAACPGAGGNFDRGGALQGRAPARANGGFPAAGGQSCFWPRCRAAQRRVWQQRVAGRHAHYARLVLIKATLTRLRERRAGGLAKGRDMQDKMPRALRDISAALAQGGDCKTQYQEHYGMFRQWFLWRQVFAGPSVCTSVQFHYKKNILLQNKQIVNKTFKMGRKPIHARRDYIGGY